MDFIELQRFIEQEVNVLNNQPRKEFEGYSPNEMSGILYFPFEPNSPLQLQMLSESDYKKIPILNQVKYLLNLINENKEIRLTKMGFLPTKIVSDIYSQGYIKDRMVESGFSKLYKETDSIAINITHILVSISGLIKKRHGKISLTKSAQNILENNEQLLRKIFLAFSRKFNWAYYDGYGENMIGQMGFGFSLILLSKYGNLKKINSFYAEKYYEAFPYLQVSSPTEFNLAKESFISCYSIRTFERFLLFFGLINIEDRKGLLGSTYNVSKTDIFDKLIKCVPPQRV